MKEPAVPFVDFASVVDTAHNEKWNTNIMQEVPGRFLAVAEEIKQKVSDIWLGCMPSVQPILTSLQRS